MEVSTSTTLKNDPLATKIDQQDPITTQETDDTLSADDSANDTTAVQGAQSDFSAFMRQALGGTAASQVNEEELFAALIGQRLQDESPEAADFYNQEKSRLMVSMARGDGYVPVEDVAKAALQATVGAGKIDQSIGEQINGEAFAAAQLDDNHEALFDSRGSGADPTIAVANMEEALMLAQGTMDKIESGELSIAARSLSIPSNSSPSGSSGTEGAADGGPAPEGTQSLDGDGGFLWKPVSESDGNLVVLLPTTLKGLIDKVEIHSELPPTDATKLADGRFAGDTHNGGRAHFRFDQAGAEYGDNVNLVVFKDDGSTVSWQINDGAERQD